MIQLLLACVEPPAELCEAGTIVLGSSGEHYPDLATALEDAEYTDGICLGEGTWEIDAGIDLEGDEDEPGRWIDLIGAGSDRTVLRSTLGATMNLHFGMAAGATHIGLRGLTLDGLATLLVAGAVEVEDVRSRSDGLNAGIVAVGVNLRVADLDVRGHLWTTRAGVDLRGYESMDIDGLVVAENAYVVNVPVLLTGGGGMRWTRGELRGNVGGLGLSLAAVVGDAALTAVEISGNSAGVAILTGDAGLEFDDVEIVDNETRGDHVVWVADGDWTVRGGEIRDNVAVTSVLGVYGDTLLHLDGVRLDDPDTPCEVAGGTACLPVEAGESVSADCSTMACTAG